MASLNRLAAGLRAPQCNLFRAPSFSVQRICNISTCTAHQGRAQPMSKLHYYLNHPEEILAATKPTKNETTGRWRGSALSAKQQARLRQLFIQQGRLDEYPVPIRRIRPEREQPSKGHKWQIKKQERLAKIDENMAKMDELVAEFYQAKRDKREADRAKRQAVPAYPLPVRIKNEKTDIK
eukprot:TRINITY_DN4674_c0_g1_i2.p1 TRINITY_DN4674_c0_g1~~TRINITY_DN4674_c0_g1_i2.p1  ORF type:complete len:180 (+),score=18.70 TRINITY_DN4674_c0_g1_i2:3-542(+)